MKLLNWKGGLVFTILMLGCTIAMAQKEPLKYGKIDENDLKMTVYPLDSSAHAVILCDYGVTDFKYDNKLGKGWQVFLKRVVRIKVIDKEGVSAGDFKFRLFHWKNDTRGILPNVEGITFNLENGKVIKSSLENKNVMQEDYDENQLTVKFAMPNVRAGSVIDVSYTIVSDIAFRLPPWKFQSSFPVKWSEYIFNVPEFFIYKHTLLGFNSLVIKESTSTRDNFTFISRVPGGGIYNTQVGNYYTNVEYKIEKYRIAMENIPAFREESYLTTSDNYRSIYTSEIESSKSTDNMYRDYTTTWDKVNKLLLESDDFGSVISRNGYMDDEISSELMKTGNETEKMLAILNLVKDKMRWNNYYVLESYNIRKAWKEHSGNSGDINLMLIAALHKAGLNVVPIVLSTRSNGFLDTGTPSITDLNYVVAQVKIGEKEYLLDATEPLAPAGLLPVQCLNGKGRTVLEYNSGWVDLSPGQGDKHSAQYTLILNPEGNLTGTCSHLREAYNALDFRKAVAGSTSLDNYYREKEKSIEGLEITSRQVPTLDSIYKPLKENLGFSMKDACDVSGDRILISPLLFEKTKENPFKLKERLYPVEFPYPINEMLMFTWNIPAGFVVEQLPKPAIVTLPDGGGKFYYNVTQNGNAVVIVSKIQINQTIFPKSQYELIKEFYNQIIAKQGEQILIRKG